MEGIPVEVVKILGKTGVYGEANLVLVKILDGKDKGQVRKRAVKGPLRKSDILLLLETEKEHKGIGTRRR